MLSTWGYISVVKIKTRADPALKITIKKSSEFQKHFDDFALILQQRREERDRLKAEKAATKAAEAKAAEEEAKDGEASATPEPATEASTEDASARPSPPAAEASPDQEEQTKA